MTRRVSPPICALPLRADAPLALILRQPPLPPPFHFLADDGWPPFCFIRCFAIATRLFSPPCCFSLPCAKFFFLTRCRFIFFRHIFAALRYFSAASSFHFISLMPPDFPISRHAAAIFRDAAFDFAAFRQLLLMLPRAQRRAPLYASGVQPRCHECCSMRDAATPLFRLLPCGRRCRQSREKKFSATLSR